MTVDSEATIRPLLVTARPRISFINLQNDLVHAVILVRASGGEKFVFDPTGEQHGVLPEHRFLPWTTYKEYYVMKQEHWIGRTTFAYSLTIKEIIDLTADESDTWSQYRAVVEVVSRDWVEAHGGLDLLERIRESIGGPWVRTP